MLVVSPILEAFFVVLSLFGTYDIEVSPTCSVISLPDSGLPSYIGLLALSCAASLLRSWHKMGPDEGPSGAGTQCPDPTATLHQLASALQELEDSATVHGRDAHRLRDTAVDAISDQAVNRAQTVEQSLAEASAEHLINPAGCPSAADVSAFTPPRTGKPFRANSGNSTAFQHQRSGNRPAPRGSLQATDSRGFPPADCYTCGGQGHFARQCPTPGPQVLTSDRQSDRAPAPSPVVDSASVSLLDTQEALDQANARVAALLKRNEELSRQAFGPTHSAVSSRASSLPINPVFFCMLSVLLCAPLVYSQPVWLCPTNPQDPFLQIPLPFNCSQLVPRVTSPPQNTSIHLYRPNTKTYNSPAVLCKIVDSSVTYSVNFFGARSEAHSESYRTVTIEHCRQMQQHARCEYGSLVRSGSVSKTSHTLDFTWPSAPFGCCTEYTLTVTNCFLISTMVHGRHGSSSPDSPVGDTRHCVYKDGSCVLRDGSVLLWSPDTEEACQFVFLSKLKGQQLDNVWLSSSGEFALSWSASSPTVVDCGHSLIISDQGYALSVIQRSPRAAPAAAAVGIVTSNQLAAQLLAVEDAAQTASMVEPTYVARRLVRRDDIAASYHGGGVIQLHRCVRIPPANYRLQPFNGEVISLSARGFCSISSIITARNAHFACYGHFRSTSLLSSRKRLYVGDLTYVLCCGTELDDVLDRAFTLQRVLINGGSDRLLRFHRRCGARAQRSRWRGDGSVGGVEIAQRKVQKYQDFHLIWQKLFDPLP
ncbi:unnamed protein product [Nippostrongylus brasiliensis]|uniref:CCHC-type domain-containing protein n=1 Tax=Nippostrongylus brasiliensis TaxID=27835 RepID=A0A0N4YM15_NIPBR|nr:unnamed protein product [Nippostrongylus brasiliensis]